MKNLGTVLLMGVGLLNLAPIIGIISTQQLESLYGITDLSADLEVLLRHRAVLFGLLGSFVLLSVTRTQLRPIACFAAFIAMASFAYLAWTVDVVGNPLRRVAIADIAGLVALSIVVMIEFRVQRSQSGA